MAEDEGEVSVGASVGELIPVECGFAADGDVWTEGFDFFEELIGLSSLEVAMQVFFTVLVDDAGEHLVSVQIDSAVERALSLIKIHWFSLVGKVLSQQMMHSRVTSFAPLLLAAVTNFTACL